MPTRIHHLNCGTMCPHGQRLINGEGSMLRPARLVCHVLLIERDDGLTLLDTGFGTADVAQRKRLGREFNAMVRPRLDPSETAISQVRALGLDPADVRSIVTTHLDVDHAGGLGDFPSAEVHVLQAEYDAVTHPTFRERQRYVPAQWAHGPKWVRHGAGGEDWFGFEGIRILPGGDPEVLLIPLRGHTRGHTGVALRRPDGWLLHCGDAYFHHGDVRTPPAGSFGLRAFQAMMGVDGGARRRNLERLRELAAKHGDEVELICSHDPGELDRAQ